MCINKSRRHGCLQGTLLFLLVLCVILFGLLAAFHISVYYLTESSDLVGRGLRHAALKSSSEDDMMISSQSELNQLKQQRRRRQVVVVDNPQETFGDQLAKTFFVRNCSINRWIVQSAILLELCHDEPKSLDLMTNFQFNNCLRDCYWYIGILSLLPFCLTLITLLAVCRLWLCPILLLALIYLALALGLILGTILYKSGIILTDGIPLFITTIILVCLYALLSLFLILLFGLVKCEQKRRQMTTTNGDNEKIMKISDDDDEVDDPQVPLYKNGLYSQQKRTDFDDKIKDFKYIDDDMSYVFRRG